MTKKILNEMEYRAKLKSLGLTDMEISNATKRAFPNSNHNQRKLQ